jgi:hypothetical protein
MSERDIQKMTKSSYSKQHMRNFLRDLLYKSKKAIKVSLDKVQFTFIDKCI